MTKFTLLFSLLTSTCLWGQVTPQPVVPPVADPAVVDDGVRVAVLGYHDFSTTAPETAMRIRTSKFRSQMESIRQLGIPVISMADFEAWKAGKKQIPAKSILLTFDDGWKSFYTDGYPILKELGYPFTLFLYKQYVDGGGRAMTTPMIQEMIAHGNSIGSHSVTHPYPITVKSYYKKGPAAYDAYLRVEMGESKSFLETKFPVKVTTYAYPGGYYTEEMITLGKELGYQYMFTVIPGKVKRGMPDATLPRYIILGNYDKIFEMATTFNDATSTQVGVAPLTAQTTPYPVIPEAGSIINTRLPEIGADLSTVTGINPKTLIMEVAGFGEVPATYTPETGKIVWQVNRRLRQQVCQVSVSWKDMAGKAPAIPLRWSFQIDLQSAYLPDGE
jgi:peptidoglycan/xylan/chitin deacetylase (PgdA/CDA1 family)